MNQAKQKAYSLVGGFIKYSNWTIQKDNKTYADIETGTKNAIQSALICVQEVKNNLPIKITQIREFWDEVENEINKMK